ncbi:hypothetical protein O3297_00600 [Janthinobacterium sp. SUN128]|uniref:hypothetical protein n=1 Tax=Janthinobacterium sp. SUN128 TaxID=3014790 RepID=UPI002713225F|nr:hypothetical protein [Janthinobacterium sp. SUN128]MDO8031900.1 hypothetical protein [Janthinobacterium sp. SUN128]
METTLHVTSHARHSPAPGTPRPALQQCVVPVAPTCFLLHAGAGADIGALSAYIHEIAKTYQAYGAANLTFIISDAQALQLGGFFTSENQRAVVGSLPLEMRYLFASEEGTTALSYWGEGMAKAGAR